MSLTNRILIAMGAGILLGSAFEWVLSGVSPDTPWAQLDGLVCMGPIPGYHCFLSGTWRLCS